MITMGHKRLPSKEAEAARIAADVRAFLDAGGVIQRPDKGATDMAAPHRWASDTMRFAAARKIRW